MEPIGDGPPPAREPMAEPAALPWGMDKTDVQKSSLNALTDEKLARFVIGQQKKTKFEKEREEREEKKRKADEEAAGIYSKFVASFEDNNDDDTMGKAFVRSGDSSADVYRLQGHAPMRKKKLSEMDRLIEEMQQKEADHQPAKKKLRQMDLLVEEIKSRDPTHEHQSTTGSFDTGDSTTTNLYVGNLATSVTEESLAKVFSKYGRINSVKIMWPRTDDERARRRMSGFVSFCSRREADDARVHLHDSELDGQRIVVGWGKAMKIESNVMPPYATASPVVVPAAPTVAVEGKATVVVQMPSDAQTRQLIDHVAAYVAKDGLEFENAVRAREAANPQYRFLIDSSPTSPLAIYYRWRVFAFAMGDSASQWREAPFQMTVNGQVWVPPTVPHHHSRERSSVSRRHSRSRERSRSSHRDRRDRSRSRSHSRSAESSRRSSHRYDDERSDRSRRRRRSRSDSRSPSPRRRRSRSGSRHRSPVGRSGYQSSSRRDEVPVKKDETMLTGQQLARARDLERGRERNRLPREAYDQFMELLRELTLERESIKRAMGFALDNSESAAELVQILTEQLGREDLGAVELVALLFVVSDILHNSSAAVKNASLFRSLFQDQLPWILDRLRRVQKTIAGRMSALAMRDKVLSVLTAWGSWSLFPPQYLVGLNATFLRKVDEDEYMAMHGDAIAVRSMASEDVDKLRKTCVQAGILATGGGRELVARLQWLKEFTAPATAKPVVVAAPVKVVVAPVARIVDERTVDAVDQDRVEDKEEEDVDGEPMDAVDVDGEAMDEDVDGAPLDEEEAALDQDVDGEPLDDDVDGEPLDEDVDGQPMDQDVDGEPLDEDVDGEPLDEDVDGGPM